MNIELNLRNRLAARSLIYHLQGRYFFQFRNIVFSNGRCSICSIAIFFTGMNLHGGSIMGKKNTSCVNSLGAAGPASSRHGLLRSQTPLQYAAGGSCLHLSLCLDQISDREEKQTKTRGLAKKIQKANVVLDVLRGVQCGWKLIILMH